ncbi:MAG TPA: PQQ-dependent sugar dehydrogenase [Flavisolibacter sp.]|nr:PQQ-dependent sugar dehydrogenase [Flavisolibacter sp.]
MKKPPLLSVFLMAFSFPAGLLAQDEPFARRTVVSGLNSPWEIAYGPNDSLWVTENVSYLVKRINISNGTSTTLLNLSSNKNFAPNDGGRWPQGGLMGMALHPNLFSTNAATRAAKPWVYLAYVYSRPTGQNCSTDANASGPCNFATRIVRYTYSGNSLSSPVTILENIPGSNDHNSGRLTIGPDLKLYYTIGDLGAGQFNNSSRTNNAQALDVLEGKIIRLNSEIDNDGGADDWVPNDNPFYNSSSITARDYVYSMGHRNAQGIVWGNVWGNLRLYSSEHGDKSDDEINIITSGGNYGWNEVSGYCDNNYNGLTLGGNSSVDEDGHCSATASNAPPAKTLFTRPKATITALTADYLSWPTVAPSSIDIYPHTKIPNWHNSILVTCLKAGRVYRMRLNANGSGFVNLAGGVDTASYFRGQGRYRDLAVHPDGIRFYLACDASGQTSGPTGGFNNGGSAPPNAGSILEFSYLGAVLSVRDPVTMLQEEAEKNISVSPNPAHNMFRVSIGLSMARPYALRLYNASGVLVKEMKARTEETIVNIAALPAGMYYLQVLNAKDQLLKTEKILKQE